jgi:hypothetical protein
MHRPRRALRGLALGLVAALAVAACARDAQDWKAATAADTPEAYEAFAARYPQSTHAADARSRAQELAEKRDWDAATRSDTVDSYRSFLRAHPQGLWAQEARVRIANFELAEPAVAPPAAAAAAEPPRPAPPAVARAPAAPEPAPAPARSRPAAAPPAAPASAQAAVPAAAPRAAPAAAGGGRIQLGALSTRAKADSEWTRLRKRFSPLEPLTPDVVEAQTSIGRVFRLQADVPAGSDAREICATLNAAGQGCIIVSAR